MEIEWKRTSRIDEHNIEEAEKLYGVNLPEDLKQLFLTANNGRPSANLFDSKKSTEHVIKKMLSLRKDDIENVFDCRKYLSEIDPTLFPIANDPFGNIICLKENQIVYWLHETNEVVFIANSVTEFVQKLYTKN